MMSEFGIRELYERSVRDLDEALAADRITFKQYREMLRGLNEALEQEIREKFNSRGAA